MRERSGSGSSDRRGGGRVLRERELPNELRAHLHRLRQEHEQAGRPFEPHRGGIRFADGSIWFANGNEVTFSTFDALREGLPGVGLMVAVAAGVYTYYLFDTAADGRWMGAAVAASLIALALCLLWWGRQSGVRAATRLDLGTLLLPDWLVIVSRGRFFAIRKGDVVAHEIVTRGTEPRTSTHAIRYRTATGSALQDLTGFAIDPKAVAELERWIHGGS